MLLRREIPALFVLALLVAIATYRLARRRNRLEELKRVNKAKTQFIASVSHELRTPLTGVVGFAQLLSDTDQEFSPSERVEMIKSIADQSYEVAGIVEDLLVVARAELGELNIVSVPVDLRAQAAQVLESWQPDARAPAEIAGEAVTARGDPMRIRQILRNLVSNAIRYGGDIVRVEVGTHSPSSVYVSVKDNGVGVPAKYRDRMFRPFEQIHDDQGTLESIGLGLAVSRQLARLMEGDLTYSYQEGESIFDLSLPAAPSTSQRTRQTESRTVPV